MWGGIHQQGKSKSEIRNLRSFWNGMGIQNERRNYFGVKCNPSWLCLGQWKLDPACPAAQQGGDQHEQQRADQAQLPEEEVQEEEGATQIQALMSKLIRHECQAPEVQEKEILRWCITIPYLLL